MGDVDFDLEEEKFEDEGKGENEEVDENRILEDDVIQFEEEDLIKLEELFEDIKKSPTEAPHLMLNLH